MSGHGMKGHGTDTLANDFSSDQDVGRRGTRLLTAASSDSSNETRTGHTAFPWDITEIIRWAVCAGLFVFWAGACQRATAGTIRHDRSDSSYTSLAASYPAVGSLTWSSQICSATLIDDDWILTAGHCLDELGLAASDWTFDLSDSGGGVHVGAERFVHPGWTGELSDGTDIALLRLETKEATVSPATINTTASELGQTATHVGYGLTGTGLTGAISPPGTKRAGNNVVDLYGGSISGYNDNVLFEDFDSGGAGDNVFGSATQLDLEYLIAGGDSGGGLFMDLGGGEVVAGVHSFLASIDSNLDADYGDLSGSTRVSSYASWISSTLSENDPVAPELGSGVIWIVFAISLIGFFRSRLAINVQRSPDTPSAGGNAGPDVGSK